MELQGRLEELRELGLGVAAISYDAVPVLADFAARRRIRFPLLSDQGSAAIRAFGLLNTTIEPANQLQFGIPFPGTIIVDGQGIVTARFFEPAYQERATVASMLVRLGRNVARRGVQVTSGQLRVTSYTTDDEVAPGTRFSIVLDVEPHAGMHVYAPGVTGYIPIALTVDPHPGITVSDTRFPPAEEYHFVPLDERVQVYQRAFRIVQDLVIDGGAAGAALATAGMVTIQGTLRYQACDDKECFLPQAVPLTWTVAVKPLDRERSGAGK